MDIHTGGGVCTATLKSGVQFTGKVNRELSLKEVLHLNTPTGWHTIDYNEIAAITGVKEKDDVRYPA